MSLKSIYTSNYHLSLQLCCLFNRHEEDELTAKLEQLERALSAAEDRNNAGSFDLSELERDARATTAHAGDLDKQLQFIKNSDFWGMLNEHPT